ncbi:MAG: hypothetical protein K2M87_01540 [Muribaculaceae bacterium]|nr:hypothetical protein [Muribaculaceae bacterium]
MGANGSFSSGSTNSELGRAYSTIATCGEIQIVSPKNPKAGIKLPEESHTPNRTYATFYKDGHDVKAIAKYGPDGKKIWEIHTVDHKNLGSHYHDWQKGRPTTSKPLDSKMKALLEKIRNFKQ